MACGEGRNEGFDNLCSIPESAYSKTLCLKTVKTTALWGALIAPRRTLYAPPSGGNGLPGKTGRGFILRRPRKPDLRDLLLCRGN